MRSPPSGGAQIVRRATSRATAFARNAGCPRQPSRSRCPRASSRNRPCITRPHPSSTPCPARSATSLIARGRPWPDPPAASCSRWRGAPARAWSRVVSVASCSPITAIPGCPCRSRHRIRCMPSPRRRATSGRSVSLARWCISTAVGGRSCQAMPRKHCTPSRWMVPSRGGLPAPLARSSICAI